MIEKIHLDFETYSELDVRHVGAFKYAEHPSTEVLIMRWAFDDGPVDCWVQGNRVPLKLMEAVRQGVTLGAHNAQFEYCIWNIVLLRMFKALNVSIPKLQAKTLDCTAGRCAMAGLPRSLGKAGAALNLKIQKDKAGDKLIGFFCKPRKPTKANADTRNYPTFYPEAFQSFIDYCGTDVESERELDTRVPKMHSFDRAMYRLDALVNSRGIPVDIPTIKRAGFIVRELEKRAHARVIKVTGIKPTQVQKLKAWMAEQGVDLANMQADTLKALLANPTAGLTDDVRMLLELRMEASKVSTKKLISMLRVACEDDRARGTLLYYGAHTGRWSGRLIQPHNFIRGLPNKKKQVELMAIMFVLLNKGDADLIQFLFDAPLTAIAQCMRGFIMASGNKILRVVDYAQIEARILVWLAEQEDVIQQFRDGLDPYKILAAFLWSIRVEDVSDDQRRIAKNLVLGCGFGLGADKFIVYCAKQGVIIDAEMSKRAVKTYRTKNDKVVTYWGDVDRCCIAAVRSPGKMVRLRNVSFYCEPDKSFLRIILPSGRSLYYPSPEVRVGERFGKPNAYLTFMTEIKGMWLRTTTYGGKEVENIVQGIACDVMVCGGIQAEKHGDYPLVLTVHDEWLAECEKRKGSVKELERLVCTLPECYAGCPITAEGFETQRYRKN